MEVPGLSVKKLCLYLEKLIHVPIVKIDREGVVRESYIDGDIPEWTEDFRKKLSQIGCDEMKILKRDEKSIYGAVSNGGGFIYLFGPVQITEKESKNRKEQVYNCSFTTFIETMMMFREYLTGKEMDLITFLKNQENEEYVQIIERQRSCYHFEQQENGWIHNSYAQEQREQNAIREGNLEKLKNAFSEPMIGRLGVSSKSHLRSAKNNALTVIAISIRSAIEGGLDAEETFRLSDDYMTRIEAQNNIQKLVEITRSAEVELTKLVADYKRKQEKSSPYIDQCKKYIYRHLHQKISIAEIAQEIGVTESYLSYFFRKQENTTITNYILNLKIYYAQNLLIYSEYNYDEIAYYFGFSSRSHFGAVFKKITGETPKQFRDKYRARDFFMED